MKTLSIANVENELMDSIKEVKEMFNLSDPINGDVCPGNIGIASQVLIDIMVRIGIKLGITISDNAYIFHDKDSKRQLSIREAAQKLINVAKNGK